MRSMSGVMRWFTAVCILVPALVLSGCVGVTLQQMAREDPPGGARYTQIQVGGDEVKVFRAGLPIDAQRGMQLQPGDEIETGAGGAAMVRFLDQGDVILAPGTRIRIGSLEVLFGRIFATVRGLFTASSENVVAGVEGTRFVFEVGRDRAVRVVVLDGVVTCRSRTESWPALHLGARQALTSEYPNTALPRIEPASIREIEEIQRWAREVTSAEPREPLGWCCDGGRVTQTFPRSCRGQWYLSRAAAERACVIKQPEPLGWCCVEGRITQTIQARCVGQFYLNRAAAERACPRPPEPMGWCCAGGRVTQTVQGGCVGGRFYRDRAGAERACAPPPSPMGWCCAGGKVTYGRRDACRGKFFTNQASANAACVRID